MNTFREAWLEIDLDAIESNVAILRAVVGVDLWAVVKANGYGHGDVQVAKAAVAGGAAGLCVALVEEGVSLRQGGITAPVLMLSEAPPSAMVAMVAHKITPAIYSLEGLRAYDSACAAAGFTGPLHIKIDTGMNRVGVSPVAARQLIDEALAAPNVRVDALFTHFACADEPENDFTHRQAERLADVACDYPLIPTHACNSGGALAFSQYRQSMVRMGIAIYGIEPSTDVPLPEGVRPALSLKAKVSYAKDVDAGQRTSYGQRYEIKQRSRVTTIPVGYADGVPRPLGALGVEVLVNGQRRAIAGTVTMDQMIIDCGEDDSVERGTEVVLLGTQGNQKISAEDWAEVLGTIGYEVVCRFGSRLERRYVSERQASGA